MNRPTVLLCGFGAFGVRHHAAWRSLGAHVLVCDPSEEALGRAIAAGIDANDVAAVPDDLLQRADCVAIVTPPKTHLALAEQALAADKPVLVEKPAVTTLDEAHALMEAQARSGCLVQVNMVLRAHPMTMRALDVLEDGDIGQLALMDGQFRGWKRQHLGVALEENDGVHFLDLMQLFAGASIAQVGAHAVSLPTRNGANDLMLCTGHANGIAGRLALGMLLPGDGIDAFVPGAQTDKVLKLVGDKGCLTLDYNANRLTFRAVRFDQSSTTLEVVPSTSWSEAFPEATPEYLLASSAKRFLATIDGTKPPLVTLHDGALQMARVLAAIPTAREIAATRFVPVERIAV
jgi:predicted dehydrogenase